MRSMAQQHHRVALQGTTINPSRATLLWKKSLKYRPSKTSKVKFQSKKKFRIIMIYIYIPRLFSLSKLSNLSKVEVLCYVMLSIYVLSTFMLCQDAYSLCEYQ